MGRLLEIARAALAECEAQDAKCTDNSRYAALMQAALAAINRAGSPAGMILWLDTARPELYMELTSRIPDEIDRLWNSYAPLDQFQAVLDRLVAVHRECRRLYREALDAQNGVIKHS
jgi:hypothetical protein